MSLEDDWAKAKPATDLSAEWEKAKPISAAPAPKESPLGPLKYAREAVGAVAEPALTLGTGALSKLIGVPAGLGATAYEMIRGKPEQQEPRLGATPQGFQQALERSIQYEPKTDAGQFFTKLLGLPGQAISSVAGGISQLGAPPMEKQGPVESVARGAVKEGLELGTMFAGAGAPRAAASLAGSTKGLATDVMQSALKPTQAAQRTGKSAGAIETLLEEGINVTKGGAEKLQSRVDSLNDRIKTIVDTSPAMIDKVAVTSGMQKLLDKFQKQVAPLEDVRAIQKTWDEFMAHPLLNNQIPVKTAQEMKQGTYRALGDKSYGELKSADIEAQKTLARGLKEEIAKAVPEVRPLNAEESKLLNALTLVERRVLMEANKNPIGLGWLSTSPSHLLGWMADRSGLFKSLIARMLNTGAEAMPAVGAMGPVAGIGVTQQATQLPPPPQ